MVTVMTHKKIDQLLDSAYDGIQEYDNDLPKWWIYLFLITVVLGIAYAGYVHLFGAPSDQQILASDMNDLEELRRAYSELHAPKTDGPEALLARAAQSDLVEKGRVNFANRCAPCHGQKAEGVVGPNLTDEYWIHGGKIEQIQAVVVNGVPDKGMMAWKALLTQDEIDDIVAYLWTVRNTNVPGKAVQGEKQ